MLLVGSVRKFSVTVRTSPFAPLRIATRKLSFTRRHHDMAVYDGVS